MKGRRMQQQIQQQQPPQLEPSSSPRPLPLPLAMISKEYENGVKYLGHVFGYSKIVPNLC